MVLVLPRQAYVIVYQSQSLFDRINRMMYHQDQERYTVDSLVLVHAHRVKIHRMFWRYLVLLLPLVYSLQSVNYRLFLIFSQGNQPSNKLLLAHHFALILQQIASLNFSHSLFVSRKEYLL